MAEAESHWCPRCTSPNTVRKESANKLGLTIHECNDCGAQFTLHAKRRDPLRPSDSNRLHG